MKVRTQSLLASLALWMMATSALALPVLIDFEDVAVPSGTSISPGTELVSSGFRFTTSLIGTPFESSGLNLRNNYSEPSPLSDFVQQPNSESTYLAGLTWIRTAGFLGRGYVNRVTMQSVEGLAFDLLSLDSAETFVDLALGGLTDHINLRAITSAGEEFFQRIDLDGVFDSAGPGQDFETLLFGSEWRDLASITISSFSAIGSNWNVDNIRLETRAPGVVPTPGTLFFLMLGLLALAANHSTRASSP